MRGIDLFDKERLAELIKESRETNRKDAMAAQVFEAMIATTGWSSYVRELDRRLQTFADQMLRPAGSLDGCLTQEFIKGAMFGLTLARDIPSVTIAAMKDLRPEAEEE